MIVIGWSIGVYWIWIEVVGLVLVVWLKSWILLFIFLIILIIFECVGLILILWIVILFFGVISVVIIKNVVDEILLGIWKFVGLMYWIVLGVVLIDNFFVLIEILKCLNIVLVWFWFIFNFLMMVGFLENKFVNKMVFFICVFVIFIW